MPLVQVENLTKLYSTSEGWMGSGRFRQVTAVDNVSLSIEAGETLGLVGESGCGKTTLGRMMLRLIEPTSGRIHFEGRDVLAASSEEMRRLRRDMQIVFQDPVGSLNPRMRIFDIVTEPLIIHGHAEAFRAGSGKMPLRQKAAELMRAVGLDESALGRYPHEFSGGQRQRIGIARALALKPKFIVADEPVSALDVSVGAQIINLLARLQREFGLTYLFISHSMPIVRYLSTRIAVMHAGKIVELGSAEQVTEHAAHPFTRTLIAATPGLAV